MPEGDAVRRTAARLDAALSGQQLIRTDLRVPRLATTDLRGGTVTSTRARGKHLLTRIEHDTGAWTLHTHLRMDGSWRVLRSGQRWPHPGHQARVVLAVPGADAVGFLLGVVELWRTDDEADRLAYLGPDLLDPEWDVEVEADAVRRLAGAGDAPVFEAIRDQRNLAGIGTIYAAETLFVLGVHPLTPVSALSVDVLIRLVRRARQLLRQEWSRSGRLSVYGRRSCRRCGHVIDVLRVGPPGQERPAHVCPHCQPAP